MSIGKQSFGEKLNCNLLIVTGKQKELTETNIHENKD